MADDPEESILETTEQSVAEPSDAEIDELLANPKFAQVVDRRTAELVEQRQREDAARRQADAERAEAERLRTLRRADPIAFAEEVDRQEAEREARETEGRPFQELVDVHNARLEKTLSKEALAKLAGKSYTAPTHAQAYELYLADVEAVRLEDERARPGATTQSSTATASRARGGKDFQSEEDMATALERGDIDLDQMRSWYARHGGLRTR